MGTYEFTAPETAITTRDYSRHQHVKISYQSVTEVNRAVLRRGSVRNPVRWAFQSPEEPSTQYLRTLVPKTISFMAFGIESLKIQYLDPLGSGHIRIRGAVLLGRAGEQTQRAQ